MKIAHIALHFAEYTYSLANAMAESEEVLMIAEKNSFLGEMGTLHPSNQNKNLKIEFIEHSGKLSSVFSNTNFIKESIRCFGPDVIHVQEVIWDYLIFAIPYLKKFPLVLTIHDPELHSGETKLFGIRKRYQLYRRFLRRVCNAVVAHGVFLKSEVERLYPRLKGRVFSIPHGPLGQTIQNPEFNWVPGTLLFFGRIQAYKGLVYFIEAVEQLAAEGLPVKGVIAGRGGELDSYRQRISGNGLFELNEGFIPSEDVPALFGRSNIVVLPYTDGTQSGVAALSMGFSRPVVASRVGSIPELVRHEQTGLLVEPRSVSDLVDKLRTLIQDQAYGKKLGENGWLLCQSELSWKNIAALTIQTYRNIISTS